MSKIRILSFTAVAGLVLLAVSTLLPPPPVVVPVQLPAEQRLAHRHLQFEGIPNFRDLGGYAAEDGRTVKWGQLYRSGTLHEATDADLESLHSLGLVTLVDFRSSAEKSEEPDRLPDGHAIQVVEIPTLDGGDNSVADEILARIETNDWDDFEPESFMLEANRHFASRFTPQFTDFLHTVLDAGGEPLLWHCTAGKDRAGYASAVLLRILGVPLDTVVEDYALSKDITLEAREKDLSMLRMLKGDEAADKLTVISGVEPEWLLAGMKEIDRQYGSFDNYVRDGLGLNEQQVQQLRDSLLE